MTKVSKKYEWSAARGEKWCASLSGMEGMLKPVEEPLLQALCLDAPYRIADVGCGGGGMTLQIWERSPEGSLIHGFDISGTLIKEARKRVSCDSLVFELADVAVAKPPTIPYDRLVSRFGVMFFDDPSAAFCNLQQWLAPDGRFAFAVWGPPADNPWVTTVKQIVSELIELPPSEPEAPGPFRYADTNVFISLLEASGFREIEKQEWRGSLPIGGGLAAKEAAHFVLASFSMFAEMLTAAGDTVLTRAIQLLTKHFLRYQRDGRVQMDALVHILTGTRI